MRTNRDMLKKEIESQMLDLCVMEAGSEEKDRAIDGLVKLYKLELEEKNRKKDILDKIGGHTIEFIFGAGSVLIGLLGVRWRADFEKEGVITGRAYDELGKVLNRILPKKH